MTCKLASIAPAPSGHDHPARARPRSRPSAQYGHRHHPDPAGAGVAYAGQRHDHDHARPAQPDRAPGHDQHAEDPVGRNGDVHDDRDKPKSLAGPRREDLWSGAAGNDPSRRQPLPEADRSVSVLDGRNAPPPPFEIRLCPSRSRAGGDRTGPPAGYGHRNRGWPQADRPCPRTAGRRSPGTMRVRARPARRGASRPAGRRDGVLTERFGPLLTPMLCVPPRTGASACRRLARPTTSTD